jgi:TRAP-type C4-dicarboxylate transport system permease small subunit
VLAFGLGLFLVVQGWQFTTLAMATRIPPTDLPGGVLYAILPISGAMMALYSALHFFGFDWQDPSDDALDLTPANAEHPAAHVPVEREAAG